MNEEVWHDIEGYEGMYQVSNLGRIKSLERKTYNPSIFGEDCYRTVPEKIRKPNIMHGYHCVALVMNGKSKVYRIHRLVAEAFIGKAPTSIHQINHKDGNKSNNNVDNLEWVTPKENTQHAIKTGLMKPITEERKKQIGIKSKALWQTDKYRLRQSEAARQVWKQNKEKRIKQITDGIHKSTSQRYLRNRTEMINNG